MTRSSCPGDVPEQEDLVAAWEVARDDAQLARAVLDGARERLRVARGRAADRLRLAEHAAAARQEAFALGLRDAADAHAAAARAIEQSLPVLECRCEALQAVADARRRTVVERSRVAAAGARARAERARRVAA